MQTSIANDAPAARHHFRFHAPHAHLSSVFGDDWFGKKAEDFARFFGTPTFLVSQTVIVGVWIALNVVGVTAFDVYPFILLNLAFSLQAAYAAPLAHPARADAPGRPRQGARGRRCAAPRGARRRERRAAGTRREAVDPAPAAARAEHGADAHGD